MVENGMSSHSFFVVSWASVMLNTRLGFRTIYISAALAGVEESLVVSDSGDPELTLGFVIIVIVVIVIFDEFEYGRSLCISGEHRQPPNSVGRRGICKVDMYACTELQPAIEVVVVGTENIDALDERGKDRDREDIVEETERLEVGRTLGWVYVLNEL